MKKLLFFIWFLVMNFSFSVSQPAEYPAPGGGRGSFIFNLENDVWLQRDDGYTNGIGFTWVSPPLREKQKSGLLRFLYRLNINLLGDDNQVNKNSRLSASHQSERWVAISLTQGTFTPADLFESQVIRDDRPYAGLLYGSLSLIRNTGQQQDSFGAAVGVIGPASLADAAQKWLHRTYGWVEPQGWANQLKNEPIFELWFGRLWNLTDLSEEGDHSSCRPAVKMGLSGQVGNLTTAIGTVLDLKFGLNLKPQNEAFVPSPLFNQLNLLNTTRTSIYAFCRLEGKLIFHNLLLEGNTFQSSPEVEARALYGQLTSGMVYQSQQAVLGFYAVLRTKEFKGQRYFDPYCGLIIGFNL